MAFIVFIYSPFYIHICTLANSDYLNEYTRLLFQIIFCTMHILDQIKMTKNQIEFDQKKIDNDEL